MPMQSRIGLRQIAPLPLYDGFSRPAESTIEGSMPNQRDSGTDGKVPPADAPREAGAAVREARLAAALRDNLRRRKQQARGRQAEQIEAPSTGSGAKHDQPPSK
jgi:hypothetical protein